MKVSQQVGSVLIPVLVALPFSRALPTVARALSPMEVPKWSQAASLGEGVVTPYRSSLMGSGGGVGMYMGDSMKPKHHPKKRVHHKKHKNKHHRGEGKHHGHRGGKNHHGHQGHHGREGQGSKQSMTGMPPDDVDVGMLPQSKMLEAEAAGGLRGKVENKSVGGEGGMPPVEGASEVVEGAMTGSRPMSTEAGAEAGGPAMGEE